MKNVSVGKKLLFGFGAVVLMIAIILALTIITSLSRNASIREVTLENDLQRESNLMLNNFNLARVEIRTLFTSIDAEAEYNLALEYLALCGESMDKMTAISEQLGGYMGEDIVALRNMFQAVEDAIMAVGDNDEAALAAIAHMMDNGTAMFTDTTELYTIINDATLNLGNSDPAGAMSRMRNTLIPVKELGDVVATMRVDSRELMLNQNLEVIEPMRKNLDEIERRSTEIRTVLTTDAAREATDRVLAEVVEYRKSLTDVEQVLLSSDREIATAREVFLQLNNLVSNYVETIAQDVLTLNDSVLAQSARTMVIMVAVGVIAAVFSVVIAITLAQMITRPLNKMKNIAVQAGMTGNLNFSEDVKADILKEAEAKDEIGQSLSAFTKFVNRMIYMGDCLERVSQKDLSIDITLLGETDTMGHALKDMVENLNDVFAEINSASTQVATAAHEIATGAQSLAQGSTEQAATVQEISASVNEINRQMNISSETAINAVEHSDNMSRIAAVGNEKMGYMARAMNEINDASQAIGRVIKVIDDIAFQTNILALNAAVEAARAGQHGKGFAVVADEVRNLAGKSAEAAKETAELISTNIEKTDLGLSYTHETVESLTQITVGIAETSESLRMMAEQSRSAKDGTAQVTQAVDQVAQVVQQNSANSEESAAASEELSSQAQILKRHISQFKLKNGTVSTIYPRSEGRSGWDEPADKLEIATVAPAWGEGRDKDDKY